MFLAELSVADGASLIAGMTAHQVITIMVLSCIAIAGLLWVVRWLVDERIGDLPQDIKDIKRELYEIGREINDIRVNQTRLEGKLWTHEDVVETTSLEVQKGIKDHQDSCPYRLPGGRK